MLLLLFANLSHLKLLVDWIGLYTSFPADQQRPELAWLGTETNELGTDEFLKWCEIVGTEPYFALNFGTGMLQQRDLV